MFLFLCSLMTAPQVGMEKSSMKYIYLVNRFQHGKQTGPIIQKLKKASELSGRDYRIRVCNDREDVHKILSSIRGKNCVVTAIGGDGSINYLLNELVSSGNILSFLPLGTGNDFCRGCIQTLHNGIHKADIVRINERYFINTACFGIDADIANDERYIHKKYIPRSLRFHASVLHHFLSFKEGRYLRVEYDEGREEGDFTTVVAANNQYYGGGYRVSPASRIDDGLMEIYLVKKLNRIRMAKVILSMKDAGHLKDPSLTMIRTKKLMVSSLEPVTANIDGEPLVSDRFDLELIQGGIRLAFNRDFIRLFQSL